MKIAFNLFIITNLFFNYIYAADTQKEIESAIKNNKACTILGDFYWEVGNGKEKLFSGKQGSEYSADTKVKIASASKWIFGAYALEKLNGKLTDEQKDFLHMQSGYINMGLAACASQNSKSVKDCFLAQPKFGRLFRKGAAEQSDENKGKFYYNGGHAQALSMKAELGLSEVTTESLGKVVGEKLNLKNLEYDFPQLAGGINTSAEIYGQFLRNMISDKYVMSKTLQSETGVCANKSCDKKVFADTPVPKEFNWWYGNHYWIEKDKNDKVEAYSSAGLFGFYPWISADKKYYGIISRKGKITERGIKSVYCGQIIRDIFLKNQK